MSFPHLHDKTVLITGASAGIGRASALDSSRPTPPSKSTSSPLDVADRAAVFAAVASLPPPFAAVDVLVNNAGLAVGLDPLDCATEEAYDVVMATNVKGLLNVTQAVLPRMKERDRGCIINMSSIAGTQAYVGGGIYCASKHAVDALTRTLRLELVSTGIRVASIDPGMVETEFSVIRFAGDEDRAKKVYQGLDPLTAEDIAEMVVFVASRPPGMSVANMEVYPTHQAAAHSAYRRPASAE
ncbi:hypothetical protein DFJ73DRAFT_790173 [Zopfochytrium polystomum]|nr:hypothetical protein DFJ73DRAFT_790173 [Zopfochytrium polystomum]